jgi:hypothetical protein
MSSSLKFSDKLILEGSFKLTTINSKFEDINVLYEDHNQIQSLGANVLCRLLCTGYYGKGKPIFSNIKASASSESVVDSDGIKIGIPKYWLSGEVEYPSPPRLPGDPASPEMIVEADIFTSTASTNLYRDQYIRNEGIFLNPPPTSGEITSGESVAAFHHFGLYMSSFTDIEEYLYAYKYTEVGFSYPTDFGLRVVWTVNFSS